MSGVRLRRWKSPLDGSRFRRGRFPPRRILCSSPFGLIGSALLFVGVFCPIVSIPIMGQVNYFQNGKGDGVIIIVLAAASALLSIARVFRFLWLTGGAALGLLIYTFVRFRSTLSEMEVR